MILDLIENDFFFHLVMNWQKCNNFWSSSLHIDNKKKDVLILGKGPTKGLEHTLTAEKLYSINFNKNNANFV